MDIRRQKSFYRILKSDKELYFFDKETFFMTCPYFNDRKAIVDYFWYLRDFTEPLSLEEVDMYLERGIRRFGYVFFRDTCPLCRKCIPIRVLIDEFKPSKSQKRVLKKAERNNIKVEFKDPYFDKRHYSIYNKFLNIRYKREGEDIKTYKELFIYSPTIEYMSVFSLDGKPIGVGFLDVGKVSLSSIYFFFDPDFSYLSLGTLSIIKEIEFGKRLGKKYYYLGYYIKELSSMNYKMNFKPFEYMDILNDRWIRYSEEIPS